MKPRAAIVILNWYHCEDTLELLASIEQTTYDPLLTVIVENASQDDSAVRIEEWLSENSLAHLVMGPTEHGVPYALESGHQYLLYRSPINLGFCAGNNLGLELALQSGAEYIVILNNDTLVHRNFLEPMITVAEEDKSVGLLGGLITHCDAPGTIWWAGGRFSAMLGATRVLNGRPVAELGSELAYPTEWVSGCMMMIPARVYRQLGGFDEAYFIWSEEWDYSLRVARAGYKLLTVPQSRICHKVGHTLGVMKPLSYYYGTRNGLIFRHKYLPWHRWYSYLVIYLASRILRYMQFLLQGRFDLAQAGTAAVWDYLVGRSGKWTMQNESSG